MSSTDKNKSKLKSLVGVNFGLKPAEANDMRRRAKEANFPWACMLRPDHHPDVRLVWENYAQYNWDLSLKKPGDKPNATGDQRMDNEDD